MKKYFLESLYIFFIIIVKSKKINFQNNLINLYYLIEEECSSIGLKIFNQGKISHFINLVFNNVEFELNEDLSEDEYSEEEFYE